MSARSAGILLYRFADADGVEVWLARMGGPFWARRDAGAWSIPKGLGEFRQASGKIITAFAGESDFAPELISSNTFELEWPPRSGRMRDFPEIDDARWFPLDAAREKVTKGLVHILDALARSLGLEARQEAAHPSPPRESPTCVAPPAAEATILGSSRIGGPRAPAPGDSRR